MFFKAEEDYLRLRENIFKTDPKRIEAMMEEEEGSKLITRIPFYNMLANQTYRSMFEYIPIINDRKFQ